MSILSRVALRMVTQLGLEGCLRSHEKLLLTSNNNNNNNNCGEKCDEDEEEEVKSSGAAGQKLSKSAKRRLRKKKLLEGSSNSHSTRPGNGGDNGDNDIDLRAYYLVTLAGERSPKDFFERSLMTAFLLQCLKTVGFFVDNNQQEEEISSEFKIYYYF